MRPLLAGTRFTRVQSSLWRDTGRHIVILGPGDAGEVSVLGGGSALVWRVLGEPLAVEQIDGRLAEVGAAPDDVGEISRCLDDLVHRGLVAALDDGGTR